MCIACGITSETMNDFVLCISYRNKPCTVWTKIYGFNGTVITSIELAVEKRVEERKAIIEKAEIGQAQTDATAPENCQAM